MATADLLGVENEMTGSVRERLLRAYEEVRALSQALSAPLAPEDQVVQTMPDVSPMKWHLAHTTWFFETFVLKPNQPGYAPLEPAYEYLFNSYYQQVGPQYPRPERGLLSRPTVDEVNGYRAHVDGAMRTHMSGAREEALQKLAPVIVIGLHHEQQHQELMLTDIKHVFAHNPLGISAYGDGKAPGAAAAPALDWTRFDGGLLEIGADGQGTSVFDFAFDNEGPRHKAYVAPFALASRPVTNGEFLAFVEDGGYVEPKWWLSDGWAAVTSRGWTAPLYWRDGPSGWEHFTLHGWHTIDAAAPVCHVSQYEAAAYAAWAGMRLPNEAELEIALRDAPIEGQFLDLSYLQPAASPTADEGAMQQLYGGVWEWTQSAYAPYPGYKPAAGAIGEYNGKFMSSQVVLRGGSCATPPGHIRATYRNFFPPDARWQFSGFRLARDL